MSLPIFTKNIRILLSIIAIVGLSYLVLILWPAYTSGLAFFDGDPKFDWDSTFKLWYLPENGLRPLLWPVLIYTIFISIFVPVVLLIGGCALGVSMMKSWQKGRILLQSSLLLLSIISITVPPMTWHAASQFRRWLID
jgi:hypothetical protein